MTFREYRVLKYFIKKICKDLNDTDINFTFETILNPVLY